jgi:hypothetical protein
MTTEQYLGLSELAYLNLGNYDFNNQTILLSDILDDVPYKVTYGALNDIASDWTLISYQPNTASGFASHPHYAIDCSATIVYYS